MPEKFKENQFGDTIVEVLFAVTILSIVLSTTYTLATRGFRTLQAAKDRTQAVFYAQEQAEALRAYRDAGDWSNFFASVSTLPTNFHLVTTGSPAFWQLTNDQLTIGGYTIFIDKNDPSIPLIGFRDIDGDGANDTFTGAVKVQWTRIGTNQTEEIKVVTRLRDSEQN